MLRSGRATFLLIVPEHFEEKLVRGERPQLLFAADASDPVAAGGPVGALSAILQTALAHDLSGPLAKLAPTLAPYDLVLHRRYNPAGITAYNIVPGLLGIILTMTLVMITAIAITREAERGTLETLLSTPVKPYEVMIGKTVPYIFVAAIQISLVLAAARLLFDVPFTGSAIALSIGLFLFVCTNLLLGFLISTTVRTQMQAMQLTFMIFLPLMLLSGFIFPLFCRDAWLGTTCRDSARFADLRFASFAEAYPWVRSRLSTGSDRGPGSHHGPQSGFFLFPFSRYARVRASSEM